MWCAGTRELNLLNPCWWVYNTMYTPIQSAILRIQYHTLDQVWLQLNCGFRSSKNSRLGDRW